jgi:hypothetical protein
MHAYKGKPDRLETSFVELFFMLGLKENYRYELYIGTFYNSHLAKCKITRDSTRIITVSKPYYQMNEPSERSTMRQTLTWY